MKKLLATLVVALGGFALMGCNSSCNPCDPCKPGPLVYKKPCCAGQSSPCASPCEKPSSGGGAAAPAPAPMKGCGAGKCG